MASLSLKNCKEIIALLCINALAFYFDNQYIAFALGADALTLGLTLRDIKLG